MPDVNAIAECNLYCYIVFNIIIMQTVIYIFGNKIVYKWT